MEGVDFGGGSSGRIPRIDKMSLSSVQRCGCGVLEYGDVFYFLHLVLAVLSKSRKCPVSHESPMNQPQWPGRIQNVVESQFELWFPTPSLKLCYTIGE